MPQPTADAHGGGLRRKTQRKHESDGYDQQMTSQCTRLSVKLKLPFRMDREGGSPAGGVVKPNTESKNSLITEQARAELNKWINTRRNSLTGFVLIFFYKLQMNYSFS